MAKVSYNKIGELVADIENHSGDPVQQELLLKYLAAQMELRAATAKLEAAIYYLNESLGE